MRTLEELKSQWIGSPDGLYYEAFVDGELDEADEYDECYGWDLDRACEERLEYERFLVEYLPESFRYGALEDDADALVDFVIGVFLGFDRDLVPDQCLDDAYSRRNILDDWDSAALYVTLKLYSYGLCSEADDYASRYGSADMFEKVPISWAAYHDFFWDLDRIEDDEMASKMFTSVIPVFLTFGATDLAGHYACLYSDLPELRDNTYVQTLLAGVPFEDVFAVEDPEECLLSGFDR